MRNRTLALVGLLGFCVLNSTVQASNLPDVESLTNQSRTSGWQNDNRFQSHDGATAGTFGNAYPEIENNPVQANQNPMMRLYEKIDALQEEIQDLRGKLEEQNYQLQTLHQNQRNLYLDLDKRLRDGSPQKVGGVSSLSLAEMEQAAKPELAGKLDTQLASQLGVPLNQTTQATSAAELALQTEPTPAQIAGEEALYNQGYQFIQNKDYDSALTAFKSMIKTYPDGKFKPNAHYWMGEIYMVQGELDLAANEFNTVYQQYPQNAKAADALLKLGYVEYAKGQWQRSKDLLSKVRSEFPGSASARLAQTRLQRMQQEGRL